MALLFVFVVFALFASSSARLNDGLRRRLDENAAVAPQEEPAPQETTATPPQLQAVTNIVEESRDELETTAHITKLHQDMCSDDWANAPPLPYENCDPNGPVNAIQENPVATDQQSSTEEPATEKQEPTEQTQEESAPQATTVTPPQLQAVTTAVEVSKDELETTAHITKLHQDMCSDDWANAPPLPYENCDPNGPVNAIPLFGGLTNALKMILLGGVGSWEENRCFFVDESQSHLNKPDEHGVRHGFLPKYMETIGLPTDHPIVVKAREENRIVKREWSDFWVEMSARRAYGQKAKLPSLGFPEIEGHDLKRHLIRRMWRPHPKYRKSSCAALENTHGLKAAEYMAFSVRRGDKGEEKFAFTELSEYIAEAEKHLYRFSSFMENHIVPKIFVATDDCSVMSEFRRMRPSWTFVSECDVEENSKAAFIHGESYRAEDFVATDDCSVMSEFRRMRPSWVFVSECDVEENSKAAAQNGFALREFKDWGEAAEDAHFTKFFTEIYAMAMSRVFIGVGYTNVSWWVYFLRPFRHSFILLDKPKGQPDSRVFDNW
eukprot:CAMPEP_0194226888 /NCGR_PEP_ID=MMETSP0156-20130528/42574_1 /TAXON_ID=33649 /ORGANISM="Thalassionema nitzschioides, Strain L26-B" /LENGTH=549 /DNA_ID=CAMNT_0038959355 /DNA_START=130 /DNA_END=1780 /DNA_ORIENTATION=+